jgi:bacillithiol biosynthesis cysteine-adding enzyme BshC
LLRKIPYKDIKYFSKLFLDYLDREDNLRLFANYFPTLENFEKQIAEKQTHQINRSILVKVLKDQNQYSNLSKSSKENIHLLQSDSTFSVTTGHQICLFTGPLYFIYKIISAINLCEQLTVKYPTNNFVPIFWMASEDHDFKEVNHIYLFGQKIEWKNKQNGAVGKMNLDGFEKVISELKIILGSHKNAGRLISLFEESYLNHENLADATRYLVNELFAKYGLVIIDGNDKDLKKLFIPQIKKDVLRSGFVDTIRKCSNDLAKNYKSQAFVRDINFFKLSKGRRKLIMENTCEREIEDYPERFSPNVLLRPLYQEVILPNIAYIGGEAEVAYWMQLKTAFTQEGIPFPILFLRNSALLINSKQQDIFQKLGFKLEDLFLSEHELNKRYVLARSKSEISLVNEKIDLDLLFQKIILKTSDISLQNSIKAQLQKQLSSLDSIQEKLIRMEKKKNETAINQIAKIKRQLFPKNILQERSNNFIPYYLQDLDSFIEKLKDNFDPLSPNFVVLTLKN